VTCPNCGAGLGGAFCASCGQKATPLNPSLRDVLHNFVEEVFNVDGRTFQSIRLLLTRPGFLTREYVEGRRVRYVSPIRLYLLFSVLYFAVAVFAPGMFVKVTVTPEAGDTPPELQRLDQRRQAAELAVSAAIGDWAPRVMFVLVPLFAGLVALAARSPDRKFPQHLYFALHVHAVWFFAGALAAAASIRNIPLVSAVVSSVASVYAAMYFILAFRRTYTVSTGAAILRSTVVGVTYLVLVVAALAAIILPRVVSSRAP
jgi:Protein of unknown function (DUF3667)